MGQTKKFLEKYSILFLALGNANAQRIINLKDELNDIEMSYQLKALSQTDLKSLKNLRKALLTDVNSLRVPK